MFQNCKWRRSASSATDVVCCIGLPLLL